MIKSLRNMCREYSFLSFLKLIVGLCIAGSTGCAGFFFSTTTTTTLTSSASSITYGASVILTAKVVSASASGTVTFYEGSAELGTGTISDGVATYTTAALAEGTQTLTAVYGGDTTYDASTSADVSVVVSESLTTTTTTLSSSSTDTSYGASVTLTALLSATATSGTVTFYNGTITLGTSTLSAGVASLTITTLPVGTNTITATYIGDSVYASSTSGSVAITITAVTASSRVTQPGDHAVLLSQLLMTAVQMHGASEYAKFSRDEICDSAARGHIPHRVIKAQALTSPDAVDPFRTNDELRGLVSSAKVGADRKRSIRVSFFQPTLCHSSAWSAHIA